MSGCTLQKRTSIFNTENSGNETIMLREPSLVPDVMGVSGLECIAGSPQNTMFLFEENQASNEQKSDTGAEYRQPEDNSNEQQ